MKFIFNKRKIRGLNLIEIIVAIVIVGILAVLAIVRYGPTREETFDREAQENLRLIQAAEKLYRARFVNIYYPNAGPPSTTSGINTFLKLDLPTAGNRWDYETYSTGCAKATRASGTARYWHMEITDEEPVSGDGCP